MKKFFLAGALALAGLASAQTTGFRLGAHVGMPTGDASDAYSVNLGADVAYIFPVATEFNLGIASGYSAYIGKSSSVAGVSYTVPTASLIPVAAVAEFKINPQFTIGADLGYGFLNTGDVTVAGTTFKGESTGGFYYQPKVAYNFGPGMVVLSYKGVSVSKNDVSETLGSVNLGYQYNF